MGYTKGYSPFGSARHSTKTGSNNFVIWLLIIPQITNGDFHFLDSLCTGWPTYFGSTLFGVLDFCGRRTFSAPSYLTLDRYIYFLRLHNASCLKICSADLQEFTISQPDIHVIIVYFFSFCYFCFWFIVFLELARPRMQFTNQLTNKNKQRQAKIHMYLIGEQAEMHLNTFVRSINDKC